MKQKPVNILILEDDQSFRERLKSLCAGSGRIWTVGDPQEALELLERFSFQLVLLDWPRIRPLLSTFGLVIENCHPKAVRVALFSSPRLEDVIAAMKWGMDDVLWPAQDTKALRERMAELLSLEKGVGVPHAHMGRLMEKASEQAADRKSSLFQARKEFSKVVLRQLMNQQKLRRSKLADLMSVSPRTLQRLLLN